MYSPFRHIPDIAWKRNPIHLTFFVTRRCNSRCPFCFYLKSENAPASGVPELSVDEIDKVSSSLGDLLWLAFSGGEIFLRQDISEIARIFYERNKPAIMLFPTNGLLPAVVRDRVETIVRSCPKSVVALKLSLDGLGEAHDALRNTPGSFAKTLETYHAVAGLIEQYPNFELGVNTVFCSENQESMKEIIEYVRGMKSIKTHTISLVRGRPAEEQYGRIETEKYFEAIRMLEENLKRGRSAIYRFRGSRIKAAQDIVQRKLIHETFLKKRRLIPCYAGRINLVLGETGDVYPCEILTTPMGNVRDYGYDLRRVAASENARRINSLIRAGGCWCTHECYFMTNILFNPMLHPAVLREYLQMGRR